MNGRVQAGLLLNRPTARLFRVIVPVSSIDEGAAYYAAVLDKPGRRISPGRHYFGCGQCILACFDPRADGDPWDAKPNPDHICFAVDEVEEYFRRVKGSTQRLHLAAHRDAALGREELLLQRPVRQTNSVSLTRRRVSQRNRYSFNRRMPERLRGESRGRETHVSLLTRAPGSATNPSKWDSVQPVNRQPQPDDVLVSYTCIRTFLPGRK